MRKAAALLVLFISVVFSGTCHAEEWTVVQPIEQVLYDGSSDYLYLVGAAPWGAPSCPRAKYAYVHPSLSGHKKLLALALTAKGGGIKVQMRGICDSDGDYIRITYIVL